MMSASKTKTQVLLETANDFMDIMQCYQECQEENRNFNPQQAVYDLYCDLVDVYEYAKEKTQAQ